MLRMPLLIISLHRAAMVLFSESGVLKPNLFKVQLVQIESAHWKGQTGTYCYNCCKKYKSMISSDSLFHRIGLIGAEVIYYPVFLCLVFLGSHGLFVVFPSFSSQSEHYGFIALYCYFLTK